MTFHAEENRLELSLRRRRQFAQTPSRRVACGSWGRRVSVVPCPWRQGTLNGISSGSLDGRSSGCDGRFRCPTVTAALFLLYAWPTRIFIGHPTMKVQPDAVWIIGCLAACFVGRTASLPDTIRIGKGALCSESASR